MKGQTNIDGLTTDKKYRFLFVTRISIKMGCIFIITAEKKNHQIVQTDGRLN